MEKLDVTTDFPTDYQKLLVQIFYLDGDPAFVCGASGRIAREDIEHIEGQCNDNLDECFPDGEGEYLFQADFFSGQYGDDGRCELAPGWELTKLAFRKICWGLKDMKPAYT